MIRIALGIGVGLSLACAGGRASLGASERDALFFRPSAKGCDWVRWSTSNGAQIIGTTSLCPEQVVFKPDGSKVVYSAKSGEDMQAIIAAWPALTTLATLPYPAEKDMRWQPLWVAADGVLRLQSISSAKETQTDNGVLLTLGTLSALFRKGALVLPGDALFLDAKYEANRSGSGWTLLSAGATTFDLAVAIEPSVDKDAWPSIASGYRSCRTGQNCDKEAWKDRADLKALLGKDIAAGFLPAGQGGWLFGLQWGDTPHATDPVFSCADPDCKKPLALQDLPKDEHSTSYAIQPDGDYVLIGFEHILKGAYLYRLGQSEPVYAAPDAVYAGWIPKDH